MNALHRHGAFHLKISKHPTTINSLRLSRLCQVVNRVMGGLYLWRKLTHLESGQGRGLCHCKAVAPSSF